VSEPAPFPVGPHDQTLVSRVHPPDWPAPAGDGRYNLVAIGGGAAGLVTTIGTAGLGGKAALIERHLLGGDCLNVGCVPSKALLRAAHAAHAARTAEAYGVRVGSVEVDFAAVMDRLRRERARISAHDAAARFRDAGVDVFLGHGRFIGPDAVEVGGRTLRFANAVIATGGKPIRPPIPGLEEVGALTNEEVWNLTELPARLVVIGAGPIGCELAQAFARLGSAVVQVDAADRVLARDDADASALVAASLQRDGVTLKLSRKVVRLERDPDGSRVVVIAGPDGEERLVCDQILLAVGRAVNTEGLGLEAAGVVVDARGRPVVDGRLRTSNPRVWAAGDAAGRWQFTHAADAMARVVLRNALFFGRGDADGLVMPWTTFTDPEVAHVGLTAEEAAARPGVSTLTVPLSGNDRVIVEGEEDGFLRVHHDAKGRILGATLCGPQAGEIIAAVVVAMAGGTTLGTIAGAVLPYPTRAEVLKRAADAYNRTKLTPTAAWLLKTVLAWRR
jgi:pyruvate/2-oxoglutarate dehydrogenase complex dihydrolipoamide dehydrogenase (E3) component